MTRNSSQRKSISQAGFTLVEVLVSLVISAAIMAGLTTLASSVNLGWSSVARKLSAQEMVGNGLAIAAGDISRIERVADYELTEPVFRFRGVPFSMTFIISERPASGARGLYWIYLYTRKTSSGMALVRTRVPFDTTSGTVPAVGWADEVILMEGALSFDFSYRAGRSERETWHRDWTERNSLPGLVKIRMSDFSTGAEAYPPFVIALKAGAEAACADIEGSRCTMRSAGKLLSEAN